MNVKQFIKIVPDPVVIIDPKTKKIIGLNEDTCALFSYQEEELIGKEFTIFASKKYTSIHLKNFDSFINNGAYSPRVRYKNVIGKNKKGENVFVDVCFEKFEMGEEKFVLLFFHDISHVRIIEKDNEKKTSGLEKAIEQLKVANKEKNQLLGVAAHDLRTPLSIINYYASFLKEKQLDKEAVEYVKNINDFSNFMLNIINDVLDFSKIESGNIHMKFSKSNLNEIVVKSVKVNRILLKNKNIKIEFSENALKDFVFDKNKMEQVINNILSNAIKYSDKGTSIRVVVKETKEQVKVSIIDQGPGIKKEEIVNLYKPFKTTSNQSTDGEKSTGIGLVIVNNILIGHESKLEVKSELGVGSEFYFYLPKKIRLDDKDFESNNINLQEKNYLNKSILVVEDNKILQKALRRSIEKKGIKVLTADDGMDALEIIRNNTIDLVFMDFNMPKMDGFNCTEMVRKSLCKDFPIVGLTGTSDPDSERKALKVGMQETYIKPIQKGDLDLVFNCYF